MNFIIEDEDGNEIPLPAKYEVCNRCQGKGTHVNENIDGNGITASEWDEWDYEDRENYMNGAYDVQCSECHGLRVELVVNEEYLTPEQKVLYDSWCDSQDAAARYDAEDRMTRRMERGY